MVEALAWILPILIAALSLALYARSEARATARIRELLQARGDGLARERDLASRLALAEQARIEAETVSLMLRNDRERAEAENAERYRKIDEALAALPKSFDGGALPELFQRMTERTATLVLSRIPDDADRNRLAAAASLGGLMTAHSYIGIAIEVLLGKVEAMGGVGDAPVCRLRPLDDEVEHEQDDTDDDAPPPSSGSLN
jgi:hypothetical protein